MKYCPVCTSEFPTGSFCPTDGAALLARDSQDPLLGRVIRDAYRIEERLGSGGAGIVYRARQLSLERDVAIKILKVGPSPEPDVIQRFFREGRLASQLSHPNIVAVYDFGNTEDGLLYLVLEYLKGKSLNDVVATRGPLSAAQAIQFMEEIVAGVSAAHALSIVHRDIKPQNVVIAEVSGGGERAKVLDFGISKSLLNDGEDHCTKTNMIVGTPGYLAPEQIQSSKGVDLRADIYALGALLYYMVTGRAPYEGTSWTSVLGKQLTEPFDPIQPDTISDERVLCLEPVIAKALSANPDERYQTCAEFLEAIRETIEAGPQKQLPRVVRQWRPTRTHWGVAASFCLLLIGIGFTNGGQTPSSHPSPPQRGVSDSLIKLGMSAPFSGPNRELGRSMKLGIDLAIAEQNMLGGVHGRRLELVALDDGYEPARTIENAKELVEKEQVFALLGNVGTAPAEAILPYLLEEEVLLLAPLTGANALRKDPPDHYVFNLRASYDEEIRSAVTYLIDKRGVGPDRIGILAQDDAFGEAGYEGLSRALRERGVPSEKILRLTYTRNSSHIEDAITTLQKQEVKPQAFIVAATSGASVSFTIAAKQIDPNILFSNLSFVGSLPLKEEFQARSPQSSQGVIVTQVVPRWDSYSSIAVRFRERLRRFMPNEQGSAIALEGYVATHLFITGLQRNGRSLTTESLIATLERTRSLDLGLGAPFSFGTSDHQASDKVWAVEFNAANELTDLDI